MTGVGDLFSNLQPVTENQSTLSLSAGRCGAAVPQKGSAETEGLERRGKPSPPGADVQGAPVSRRRCWLMGPFEANVFRKTAASYLAPFLTMRK